MKMNTDTITLDREIFDRLITLANDVRRYGGVQSTGLHVEVSSVMRDDTEHRYILLMDNNTGDELVDLCVKLTPEFPDHSDKPGGRPTSDDPEVQKVLDDAAERMRRLRVEQICKHQNVDTWQGDPQDPNDLGTLPFVLSEGGVKWRACSFLRNIPDSMLDNRLVEEYIGEAEHQDGIGYWYNNFYNVHTKRVGFRAIAYDVLLYVDNAIPVDGRPTPNNG
jgi:hypothetical protein